MKQRTAVRKRARRAQGPATDFSAMPRRQLIALISDLQTKIEQVAEATRALTAESSMSITAPAPPALPGRVPCLVIDNSVRSGQVIDYPDGDVTVVGSVGSGAEIVAGGSIHVSLTAESFMSITAPAPPALPGRVPSRGLTDPAATAALQRASTLSTFCTSGR